MCLTPNGTAFISCNTYLGPAQTQTNVNHFVQYDAVLFYAAPESDCPVISCKLDYYNHAPMDPLRNVQHLHQSMSALP